MAKRKITVTVDDGVVSAIRSGRGESLTVVRNAALADEGDGRGRRAALGRLLAEWDAVIGPVTPEAAAMAEAAFDELEISTTNGACDHRLMIIVSGYIAVAPSDRDTYLDGCRDLIVTARSTAGCLDFHLAPDPIEPGRINIYEQWESVEAVEAFRGSGPSAEQSAAILEGRVVQHEIAASTPL
jgi:quinol monooxygenase YgiN